MVENDYIEAIYPLSPIQQGMLFHSLVNPGAGIYIQQNTFNLNENMNLDAFKSAVEELIHRHPILRTIFRWERDGEPIQIVVKKIPLPISYLDWRNVDPPEQQKRFNDVLLSDLKTDFDFSKPPLMRFKVFRTGENSYQLLWTYHHILLDGWSYSLLLDELITLIDVFNEGKKLSQKSSPPYQSFIQWLRHQDISKAEVFWREKMGQFTNPTMLANVYKTTQHTNAEDKPYHDQQSFRLSGFESNLIQTFCKQRHFTMSTLFIGAWALLVHRYCNEPDIVFGVTLSGRSAKVDGIESILGTFINTLPVRIKLSPQESLIPWLTSVQEYFVEIQEYEYTPLTKIHEWSNIPPGTPLFDSIVVTENYPRKTQRSDNNRSQETEIPYSPERTSYPLTVMVDIKSTILIQISFHTQIFDQDFMNRMIHHYVFLVNQIIKNPDSKLVEIEIAPEDEKQQLLFEFNATEALYPKQKLIQEVFEEQVLKVPDNIALTFEEKELTYLELNQKANQLARRLRQMGIGRECIVGIMVERSMEMIIAILGILKAGGAYLPIDPFYPVDRIKFILEDSDAKILLTKGIFITKMELAREIIDLDDDTLYEGNGLNIEKTNKPQDLAYIIYTSGSTGKPNGAMIEHFSVINRINWMQKQYRLEPDDVILQKTTYTFDVSVWELCWWFFAGAKLCLLEPGGEKDPQAIVNAIAQNNVTTMHFVPSMLNVFLEYIAGEENADRLSGLKRVFASGEALRIQQVRRFNQLLYQTYGIRLINLYGPTEATVDVSFFDCSAPESAEIVPIGKPIDNIKLYIVNENNRLQPLGIFGELCISGAGVGRGYLNNPELTAKKFIPESFIDNNYTTQENFTLHPSNVTLSKMYRTGDLARWMPDGNIEFSGRLDHQVKIRGFRIELGEIEACLLRHESIKEAVVVVKANQQDHKYLCAYFSAAPKMTAAELRDYLAARLPDYMIPASYIQMEKLPLTLNGKLDRKALPDPESSLQTENEYIEPESDIERKMVNIWQMVLHKERIGVNDAFFDLGGDSILLIQLWALIEKEFPRSITIVDLFKLASIRKLATFIEEKAGKSEITIELPAIPVGSEYMLDGEKEQEKYAFEIEISGEKFENLSNIARNEGIALNDILLGAYFYLLGEISGQKEITVQTIMHQDQVGPLNIQLQNIEDFLSLFQTINQKRNSVNQATLYEMEKLIKSRFLKEKDTIIPLFACRQILSTSRNPFEIFDVVIQAITETDRLYVMGDYNSNRLKAKPMRDFFKTWLGLLNVIMNQYVGQALPK